MNLNKLLGVDYIDIEVVKSALANRQLLKRGITYPSLDFFTNLKLYNAPNLFSYWSGDFEIIKKGLAVYSNLSYPICDSDVFEVKTFGKEAQHIKGDIFNEMIHDSLVDIENLIPSRTYELKIYNIESVKLVRFSNFEQEAIDFFSNVDSNQLQSIRTQLVFLLNDNFPTLKVRFEDLLDIKSFEEKYEQTFINYNHLKPILFKKIEKPLVKYLETNNSLFLIEIIEAISNY